MSAKTNYSQTASELSDGLVEKAGKVFAKEPLTNFVAKSYSYSNINGKETSKSKVKAGTVDEAGNINYSVNICQPECPGDSFSGLKTWNDYNHGNLAWIGSDYPYTWTGDYWFYPSWSYPKKELTIDDAKQLLKDIDDIIKGVPNKLPNLLVSDKYPPSDIIIDSQGNWICKVALAGIKKEDINISFLDNYITIKFNPVKEPGDEKIQITGTTADTTTTTTNATTENKVNITDSLGDERKEVAKVDASSLALTPALATAYLQKGIKLANGEIKFYLDPKRWDFNTLSTMYEYGLLTLIANPQKENTKKAIEIKLH